MPSTTVFECTCFIALRIFLFLGCRKYLLRNLYFDLQTLSSDSTSDVTPPITPHAPQDTASGIELDTLPSPATQSNLSSSSNKTSSSSIAASLHSTVARTIFSLMFAECCMMFFVLMLQGIDLFSPWTRQFSWKFSLFFLMAVILVVIPLCISLLLAITFRTQKTDTPTRNYLMGPRILLSLVPVGLYLFALSKVPLPPALATFDSTFTAYLARLIVLGITILGLLSGFGAIANSWSLIPWLSPPKTEPTEQDVSAAHYSLQSIRNDLHDRRVTSERRRSGSQGGKSGNWFSRITPNFRGGDSLSQELRGLETLEQQMSRHVEALRARREAALYSRTFRGRIIHAGAIIFGVYCILRIISSLVNLLVPSRRASSSQSQTDLIADLLARLLALFSSSRPDGVAVASFARQISLVFVGLIILTSVRRVLKGATRALRVTSRNLGASLMMLLLAQLMGIYLLSTIVQLRNLFPTSPTPTPTPTLPPPDVDGDANPSGGTGASADVNNNLFSTIPEFEVFGALFDWSFLIAAGVSAFVRWGNEKVNGVGDGLIN